MMSKALGFIDLLLSVVHVALQNTQNTPWWAEALGFIDLLLSVVQCSVTEYTMTSWGPGVYRSTVVCGACSVREYTMTSWGPGVYRSIAVCGACVVCGACSVTEYIDLMMRIHHDEMRFIDPGVYRSSWGPGVYRCLWCSVALQNRSIAVCGAYRIHHDEMRSWGLFIDLQNTPWLSVLRSVALQIKPWWAEAWDSSICCCL